MKFRLVYEGEIAPRPQINATDVHKIRTELDPQLRAVWQFEPLKEQASKWLRPPQEDGTGLFENRGATTFVPLVSKRRFLQCGLDVVFLRQQAAGQLVSEGGDIDNRVKTLLDALCVPPPAQAGLFAEAREPNPMYCLLQDDSLVTKLSVETDRLLRPSAGQFDLVAIIQVDVTASRLTFGNMEIA